MEKQKISIFIDGENFIRGMIKNFFDEESFNQKGKFMHHLFRMNFDFEGFFKSLINDDISVIEDVIWYDARLNDKFSDVHRKNQVEFFKKLRNSKIRLELGKTKGDPTKGEVKQKGVDTKLVTDLVTGAVSKKFDIAYLVSSDWDFWPAVNFIQNIKRHPRIGVRYIFFHKGMTGVLHRECMFKKKVAWKEVKKFCSEEIKKYKK